MKNQRDLEKEKQWQKRLEMFEAEKVSASRTRLKSFRQRVKWWFHNDKFMDLPIVLK